MASLWRARGACGKTPLAGPAPRDVLEALGVQINLDAEEVAALRKYLLNGGVLMAPHVVREIRDADGRVIRTGTRAAKSATP